MCERNDFAVVSTASGKRVSADRCIAPVVEALNAAGLETVASCCGHGHRPGSIALRDGREIIIARNFEEARRIDRLFPLDINGEEWMKP